jgi:hypothetical protein
MKIEDIDKAKKLKDESKRFLKIQRATGKRLFND